MKINEIETIGKFNRNESFFYNIGNIYKLLFMMRERERA